jgi:uncharacterized protein DUF6011
MTAMATYNRPWNRSATSTREVATEQSAILRSMRSHTATVVSRPAATPAPAPKPAAPVKSKRELFAEIDAMLAGLPTGFYALPKREDATNGNRPFYFFKIHPFRGDKKRIVMVTGGVGAFTEIPMKALWQLRAVQGIARDLAAAAALFGKETSTCGFCAAKGRRSPLTHPRSVAAGYGKDCAELHGLPW